MVGSIRAKTIRRILLTLIAALSLNLATTGSAKPPHVVIILADDPGFGDVGVYGAHPG